MAEEEQALREAGLSRGECDAAVRFQIEPDGSVGEVILLRADDNSICNETLIAFAQEGRWSPDPEGRQRRITKGWSSAPRPGGDAEFHTYPGGHGLDTDGRFLLTHDDPRVDLARLAVRFSRLGPSETLEEVRSEAPLLCAIGRDPGGEVVMRTEALEYPAEVTADPFAIAAAAWPEMELLGAHSDAVGGSCFLLQSTVPSSDGSLTDG